MTGEVTGAGDVRKVRSRRGVRQLSADPLVPGDAAVCGRAAKPAVRPAGCPRSPRIPREILMAVRRLWLGLVTVVALVGLAAAQPKHTPPKTDKEPTEGSRAGGRDRPTPGSGEFPVAAREKTPLAECCRPL